ncbi:hypothetical protein RD792_011241 [Penstemon davidsonii]|uniref:RING-type E3 ubiquitin transferase n=1 Tax=Penstemon davidsonii TaxID=160366 RepID=A0ABR0D418_9LAMI|nr:hypothetical protein RD792_011241 [Penstemon davidsonii]
MELQVNWSTPTNAIELLQSLSKRVDTAKTFTTELQKNAHNFQSLEVKTIVQQLEQVIRSIGENLNSLPSLSYGYQEYVEKAAKSLSKEMKDVSFVLNQSRRLESKEHMEETDLYSIDIDESSAMNLTTYRQESSKKIIDKYDSENLSMGSSLMSLPQLAQYMEPLYDTFSCPLTKRVMEDPVTIESGITYERKAIIEWFEKFEDVENIVCPKSGQKLKSTSLSANVALKATINEWKERNEAARIKVARAALSLASTENMVLEAIDDLTNVCKSKPYNKVQVRDIGIIPLLANFIEYKSREVRFASLELLRLLAEDDEKGKDIIAKKVDVSTIIRMLSSNHKPLRNASVLLLLDLSSTRFLCDMIGTVAGGILMLITVKLRQSFDAFTSDTAGKILKNLEKVSDNIKLMAENGYWEPLLTHLVEGNEVTRTEMASYLAEVVLGPDIKTYVAERATPVLVHMVQSVNSLPRNVAFKALNQISKYHQNAKILIEAGVMQILIEEIFTQTIHNNESTSSSKTEAAAILAKILESGIDLENFQVNTHGHTLASDYIVYNILSRIKNSTPDEMNLNLIHILLCLIKFAKASSTIVSVVKETEVSYNLIELINTPNEELGIASIKLLITLTPFMGHTLSDRLCKTKGQPESLVQNTTDIITEKDAVSVNFLAKLPHQNLTLNLALINSNTIPTVMKIISQIQRTGTRSSRHGSSYFEGLIGILVRLTTTLYDIQILHTARTYNFTSVFTELLTRSFTDEVQKLSAIGLENLSKQSKVLSRPPKMKKTKVFKFFCFHKCISVDLSKDQDFSLCSIHGGICSSQETFCLVEAETVERLLSCMDHENVEVIEAALSALSTLLDDNVNVEESVSLLSDKHAMKYVLNVVKEHKEESLWQKAFWVIERFLISGGDESISNISEDRLLPATLVSAFHHGDDCTREMAEKILRHLNKIPTISHTMTFTM